MPLELSPDFVAAVGPMLEELGKQEYQFADGDVEGRRQLASIAFKEADNAIPDQPSVVRTDHIAPADDGYHVPVVEFRKVGTAEASKAIYYIHGGGFILGSPDMFEKAIKKIAANTEAPVFAVDYRVAPEYRHSVPVNDCLAGLKWLQADAEKLGVDPSKIITYGESAGAGLAAGLSLLARDKELNPPINQQILLFPMLDDRNTSSHPKIDAITTWRSVDNKTGWDALVGDRSNANKDLHYSAPARAEGLEGLPQTYIECGQIDILVHETIEFAGRLAKANVPVELHIYPGQPHGHMDMAPTTYYSKMALGNIVGAIARV